MSCLKERIVRAGGITPPKVLWGERLLANRRGKTEKPLFCVYNQTRESFLSLGVTAADTHLTRLRGLLGRMRLKADEGIWMIPCQGIHTIGMLFPIDLIYLDENNKVIHMLEHFGTFRIAPIRRDSASVLEMQTRTIYSSHTQVGDELLICSPEEMELFCQQKRTDRVSNCG